MDGQYGIAYAYGLTDGGVYGDRNARAGGVFEHKRTVRFVGEKQIAGSDTVPLRYLYINKPRRKTGRHFYRYFHIVL